MTVGLYRIKDWPRFQHYKQRKPPWIKLYRDLLDNYDYLRLPLASMALAPCIWLLASESEDGTTMDNLDRLCFRLHRPQREVVDAIQGLEDAGFISHEGEHASKMLARCKQDATLETETETETETEKYMFDSWYKAYPRHEARNTAERAWEKLTQEERGECITGSVPWVRAKRAAKTELKYYPLPATFLNQRRWKDEMPERTAPVGGGAYYKDDHIPCQVCGNDGGRFALCRKCYIAGGATGAEADTAYGKEGPCPTDT